MFDPKDAERIEAQRLKQIEADNLRRKDIEQRVESFLMSPERDLGAIEAGESVFIKSHMVQSLQKAGSVDGESMGAAAEKAQIAWTQKLERARRGGRVLAEY